MNASIQAKWHWLHTCELSIVEQRAWLSQRRLFSVDHDGVELIPSYQLAIRDGRWQPRDVMQSILYALGPVTTAWEYAAWFLCPNSVLSASAFFDAGTGIFVPDEALQLGLEDEVLSAALECGRHGGCGLVRIGRARG